MESLTYCRRWNPVVKEAAELLTPQEAEALHRAKKPYTVVVTNESSKPVVVEMCFFEAYCHVLFLDDKKRVVNRYSFVEVGDGRLFLEEAAVHNYPADSDRPSDGELFRFRQDGGLIHDVGKAGGPVTRQEGQTDISRNYSAMPSFGDYGSIVRRER